LAAYQRHTPSSPVAVIGLSNNDVISLRSLRCVRCVGWKPRISRPLTRLRCCAGCVDGEVMVECCLFSLQAPVWSTAALSTCTTGLCVNRTEASIVWNIENTRRDTSPHSMRRFVFCFSVHFAFAGYQQSKSKASVYAATRYKGY